MGIIEFVNRGQVVGTYDPDTGYVEDEAGDPFAQCGTIWEAAAEMRDNLRAHGAQPGFSFSWREREQVRTCRRCQLPILKTGRSWVVTDTGTTADGLSYCPPDPDAARVGSHQPAAERSR